MKVPIICPFTDVCKNFRKECWRCKWNIALEIDDYLSTDDFSIIEDNNEESE